ncbi:MAG: Maf family protein [Kiritimatiellae bacterium]|nr:Maf family protein [Kiritimatiellia bacterium]
MQEDLNLAPSPPDELVLASASPRRVKLLSDAGYTFVQQAAHVSEAQPGTAAPTTLCLKNAQRKAHAVAETRPDALVLGVDTIVVLDNDVLGKPADRTQAHAYLTRLQGRTHQVLSGVTLLRHVTQTECTFVTSSDVIFKTLTPSIIDAYLDRIEYSDKAGGYAAQDHGDMIITKINGSYSNVVGLPIERLAQELQRFSITPTISPRQT